MSEPTYIVSRAELNAEKALADDLADVLDKWYRGVEQPRGDVPRVLARYREARGQHPIMPAHQSTPDMPTDCYGGVLPDIVLPPHPHTLICPVCGLTRNLPEGWQEMLGSETLTCTTDNVVMIEVEHE